MNVGCLAECDKDDNCDGDGGHDTSGHECSEPGLVPFFQQQEIPSGRGKDDDEIEPREEQGREDTVEFNVEEEEPLVNLE